MKTVFAIMAVVIGLALAAPIVAQTDFGTMSTDQLYQMKQQGVPPEERAAFDAEWAKRVDNMTLDELTVYQVPRSEQEMAKMQQRRTSPTPLNP
jgi:uncharacterized protein (DUF2236 family)